VTGAVYAEDLEREESLMHASLGMTAELTKENLMQENDFLKLDQSKLPLWIFDNLEYEALDLSPLQWLRKSRKGSTPFYQMGEWIWKQVIIHEFDIKTSEYVIQFYPDGATKNISRLNLRFEEEDEVNFNARREFALNAREEAKKILRLDHFINQQPNESIRAIRQNSLRKIHERTIDGLAISIPFPEQGSPLGDLLSKLTKELIRWYSHTMKKTVLFALLSDIPRFRNDATVLRYKQLELPVILPKSPVPQSGKVPCPAYKYSDRKSRVASLHSSAKPHILNVYKWLQEKWNKKFQFYAFMETKFNTMQLPCSLDVFRKTQFEKLDITSKLLKSEFRNAFLDQLLDCVQDYFDFFQTNMEVYESSELYKLHRVLDAMLSTFLRELLLTSLANWQQLVEANTRLTADNVIEAPVGEEMQLRTTELTFSVAIRPPLFQVELKVMNGRVVCEPSSSDIQTAFLQAIDKMVLALREITSVDKDTMNLLMLKTRVLLNINDHDNLFADLDDKIKKTKAFIQTRVAAAMKRPMALAKLFERFIWLMEYDEYIEIFVQQSPPPSIEDFKHEIRKLDDAARSIDNTSFRFEDFDLVRVDTTHAKEMLCQHAIEMRDGLLAVVAANARQELLGVMREYNTMLDRIALKPDSERQLKELREYILESKEQVDLRRAKVSSARLCQSILRTYNLPLSDDDMYLSWEILTYPSRIEVRGKEVEVNLEGAKENMQRQLWREQEHFDQHLEEIRDRVNAAKLLHVYSDKEKIIQFINDLMEAIDLAKVKATDFNERELVFQFQPKNYGVLDHYAEDLKMFSELWTAVSEFHIYKKDWLDGDFKELDGKKIEEFMTSWSDKSRRLAKDLDEYYPEVAACATMLKEDTLEFRKHLPVIQSLASKALTSDHWLQLSRILQKELNPDNDDLNLQQLLDLNAAEHIEEIQNVTFRAEKEYRLKTDLANMRIEWTNMEFELKPYKTTGTYVVAKSEDIMSLLDDHLVKTQTMRGNPAINEDIMKQCKEWEGALKYAQQLLEAWTKCQRTWMYLEPIFSSVYKPLIHLIN
jgi:dynein heavy chain